MKQPKFKRKVIRCLISVATIHQQKHGITKKIGNQVDPSVTNVLEFRHESWWDSEVYGFMENKGLVFCSVSASGLPDLSGKNCRHYLFAVSGKNGWYKHFYPDKELEEWNQKIKKANAK